MAKIRITGLVKLANRTRQELAGPVSANRLDRLRRTVGTTLQKISSLLAEAKVGIDAMPAPSRRAYQFLNDIDFDSIATQESTSSNSLPPGSVSFPGLRSYLASLLDDVADNADESTLREIHDAIRQSSQSIEGQIRTDNIRPEQLKPESRSIRGWLAYFCQAERFDAYVSAVKLAGAIFDEALTSSQTVRPPVLVHFRPMNPDFPDENHNSCIIRHR